MIGAILVAVLVAVVVVVLTSSGSSSTRYFLALGDSLAVGIQPNPAGEQLKTDNGYVTDMFAHYRAQIPHLQLVEMGCPGDDTANVVSGQGNAAAAKVYDCDRSGGSQLDAAVAFIRAHSSQVKLVSLDIGTNDVVDCLDPTLYKKGVTATLACITQGMGAVSTNLPKILAPLKAAVAPGTKLVAGDIYDPFLAGLLVNDATVDGIARRSLALITKVNGEIAYADARAGFGTANVASAFFTYSTAKVRAPALGGSVQRNVAVLCSFTWSCTKAPRGPNIHPTTAGYLAMARAYENAVPSV